jgi:hypothetical protein
MVFHLKIWTVSFTNVKYDYTGHLLHPQTSFGRGMANIYFDRLFTPRGQ